MMVTMNCFIIWRMVLRVPFRVIIQVGLFFKNIKCQVVYYFSYSLLIFYFLGISNRCNNENTDNNRRVKRSRLGLVGNYIGFINVGSSFNNRTRITWYYKRNTTNILNYSVFLKSVKSDLIDILKSTALPVA
jgi:hypothetical protein